MSAIKSAFGHSTGWGSPTRKKLDIYDHDDSSLNGREMSAKKVKKECIVISAMTLNPENIAMRKVAKTYGEKKR